MVRIFRPLVKSRILKTKTNPRWWRRCSRWRVSGGAALRAGDKRAERPEMALATCEVVADFPELTADHVRAAPAFAAMREHRLAAPA